MGTDREHFPPPSSLISHCLFSWTIPPVERDRLDRYYILHWSVDYFYSLQNLSCITHQGIEYNTQFYECTPGELRSAKQMLLSFRRINGWERGYVLVTPQKGHKQW